MAGHFLSPWQCIERTTKFDRCFNFGLETARMSVHQRQWQHQQGPILILDQHAYTFCAVIYLLFPNQQQQQRNMHAKTTEKNYTEFLVA